MISSNDLRNGVTVIVDGNLWTVIEFLHVKPGKGAAFVRTRLKNVKTGTTLERTFRRCVGVGPKWILRRFRVHEACERIAAGAPPCWSALAAELGYFDQAHFIRDFKSQVGRTPAEYAAACAGA